MHRRRRLHRAVDRLLPRRAAPRLADRRARGGLRRYGASGRNGGWVTAELPGSRERYARAAGGTAGVRALEAALRDTVDEVGRVCAAESIACDFVRGGTAVGRDHARPSSPGCARGSPPSGSGATATTCYQFLSRDETRARVNVAGALGGLYAPASARIQPAALAAGHRRRGRAARRGDLRGDPGRPRSSRPTPRPAAGGLVARTKFGDVRARSVLRCTEGYTAGLPGLRRALLPMNSHMVVTEPLDRGRVAGDRLGRRARRCPTRPTPTCTRSGPPTAGSRSAGAACRTASPRPPTTSGMTDPSTVAALTRVLRRLFPAAAGAGIAHAWCGVLGVPRDWCASVTYHPASGTGLGRRLHRRTGSPPPTSPGAPWPTW